MAKPFLRWAGGKTQLLPELLARLPAKIEGLYYEPFVGAGALAFALLSEPGRLAGGAVLSDVNKELIATYQAVQDQPEDVISEYQLLVSEAGRKGPEDFYYELRDLGWHQTHPTSVTAARMIYLNKNGFNGLYRVNKSGGFNVPWGKRKVVDLDDDNIRACSKALQGIWVEVRAFDFVWEADPGDVVYLDPPYVPLSATSSFTSYASDGFSDADQVRLRDLALDLKRRGVFVVLSNSSADRVFELYKEPDFKVERVQARRAVNAKGNGRGAIDEVIIT